MKVKILILIIFSTTNHPIFSQLDSNYTDTIWTKEQLKKANTAKYSYYMRSESRKAIQLMNLARMYPEKFIYAEALKYYRRTNVSANRYSLSLLSELSKNNIKKPLKPSLRLHFSSAIHSVYSYWTGHVGHDYFELRLKLVLIFSNIGENCEYGSKSAEDIVFNLLIDEGVPSLGHRKNIFSREFNRVGISRKRHKDYVYNTVMDFKG